MAEWITIEDLINEYSAGDKNNKELPYFNEVDEFGDVVLNEEKINKAITSARLEIEGFLKAAKIPTNPTPLSTVEKLRECIFNITRYNYSDVDGAMYTEIEKRYEKCIKRMESIVAGRIIVWEDPTSGAVNGGIQQVPLFRG